MAALEGTTGTRGMLSSIAPTVDTAIGSMTTPTSKAVAAMRRVPAAGGREKLRGEGNGAVVGSLRRLRGRCGAPMKHHTGQFELMQCRLRCLAAAIGMDAPPEGMGNLNVRYDYGLRKWWLVGCAEGDCVLPRSTGARTVEDALHEIASRLLGNSVVEVLEVVEESVAIVLALTLHATDLLAVHVDAL